jgi:hypothetical protein
VTLQEEFGEDQLVNIYWHVSDVYQLPEGSARASAYGVSGIPEVDFDAVIKEIGAGSNAYSVYLPHIETRLAVETPVTITSTGYVADGGGTCTATFKAVDTVPYGPMTAQFVVVEAMSPSYPWSAREVATPATVNLSAAGDSAVVTRDFDIAWGPEGEMRVVIFLEDPSPWQVINSALMPDLYKVQMATSLYAKEIEYLQTAVYPATVQNIGIGDDVITVSIAQDVLPDGVGPTDWEASFRELGGSWLTAPTDFSVDAGEELLLEVRCVDNIGTAVGMALTTLHAVSVGNPGRTAEMSYSTFVETPSILLVADDAGWGFHTYWDEPLANLGFFARDWIADDIGRPGVDVLSSYWAVLWTTGGGNSFDLTYEDEDAMTAYLDGGGNLYLSSMNYLSSRPGATTMTSDYLHIASWTDDVGAFVVEGVADDEISDGMVLTSLYFPVANGGDAMVLNSPAETIFTSTAGIQGLKVAENGHKIVLTTFPYEAVSLTDPDPSNRTMLLSRIMDWFAPMAGVEEGEIHQLAIAPNFPNPFNPVTKIAYTVPSGAEHVTLTVHDVSGRVVRSLVDEALPAGPALAVWDGKDDAGHRLASGVYFARLSAGSESAFTKMTLLK